LAGIGVDQIDAPDIAVAVEHVEVGLGPRAGDAGGVSAVVDALKSDGVEDGAEPEPLQLVAAQVA
jgi:hypothetical protein